MFAQAHVYFTSKASKSKDINLLFASIFPDIAWVSKGKIKREDVHPASVESLKVEQQFKVIIEGLKPHLILDYYSHDFEGGYAFNNASRINNDVASFLGIEKGQESLLMAHNYIEAAVDLSLIRELPEVASLYKKITTNVDKKIFTEYSSQYLGIEKQEAKKIIDEYISNLSPLLMSDFNGMAEKVLPTLVNLKFSRSVDVEESKRILNKAIKVVFPTFMDFLNQAILGGEKQ